MAAQVSCSQFEKAPSSPFLYTDRELTCALLQSCLASNNRSLALDYKGNIWQWGDRSSENIEWCKRPQKVCLPSPVRFVAAGNISSFAYTWNNELWTWGSNQFGALGVGSPDYELRVSSNTPCKIDLEAVGLDGEVAQITSSCVLTDKGSLFVCGEGFASSKLQRVDCFKERVLHFAQGLMVCVAVTADGTAWTWGYNQNAEGSGALGQGALSPSQQSCSRPMRLNSLLAQGVRATKAFAGRSHAGILTEGGQLYMWGFNRFGCVGDGTTVDRDSPTLIEVPTVKQVSCGWYHTLALCHNGSLWGWGNNSTGQLASSEALLQSSPVDITKRLPSDTAEVLAVAGAFVEA